MRNITSVELNEVNGGFAFEAGTAAYIAGGALIAIGGFVAGYGYATYQGVQNQMNAMLPPGQDTMQQDAQKQLADIQAKLKAGLSIY